MKVKDTKKAAEQSKLKNVEFVSSQEMMNINYKGHTIASAVHDALWGAR